MMRKLAILLLIALLTSCSQAKETSKQNPAKETKASEQKAENSTTTQTADTSFSIFKKETIVDFTKQFNAKYEEIYKKENNGTPKTLIGEYQNDGILYDFSFSKYLGISCMENEDGTLDMAVIYKNNPLQDPGFDASLVEKQYDILKQVLIAVTAPKATDSDTDAINKGVQGIDPKAAEPLFSYKGTAYMLNTDTSVPGVVKESFTITYQ
jgi:hypothetical protein